MAASTASLSQRLSGSAACSTSGRPAAQQQLLSAGPGRQQPRRQGRRALVLAAAVTAETAAVPPSTPVVPRGGRGPASDSSAPLSVDKVAFPDIQLPLYDPAEQRTFDVVVVGSGPAGLAVADRIAAAGFEVRAPLLGSSMVPAAPAAPQSRGTQLCWLCSLHRRRRRWPDAAAFSRSARSTPPPRPIPARPPPGPQVLIVDPNPLAPWINNFGVWIDEFELMGLADCLDYTWDRALVHLDSSAQGAR